MDCATLSVYGSMPNATRHAHGLAVVEVEVGGVDSGVVDQRDGIGHQTAHGGANMVINLHDLYHTANEQRRQVIYLDGTISLLESRFSTARTTPSFVLMPIAVEPS